MFAMQNKMFTLTTKRKHTLIQDGEGNMKIYNPKKNHLIFLGNKSIYFPSIHLTKRFIIPNTI